MAMPSTSMREYETIYVLKPELDDKSAKDFMLRMKDLVTKQGGKNIKVDCLGRRKLTFERLGHNRGLYVHHTYLGQPLLVQEYERTLGIDESVILRQSMLLGKDVDPAAKQELADQLEAPVVKERRDQYTSRGFDDFDDDMGMNGRDDFMDD